MSVEMLIFVGLAGSLTFLLTCLLALRMAEEADGKISHVDEMLECTEGEKNDL